LLQQWLGHGMQTAEYLGDLFVIHFKTSNQ
jgi:hypothetical protein